MKNKQQRRSGSRNKSFEGSGDSKPVVRESNLNETCAICQKKIDDVTTLILDENEKSVHFDCVIKKLEETEPHEPTEKIVYIGGGHFAVVNAGAYAKNHLEIVRKIKYEIYEKRNKTILKDIMMI